MGYPINSLTLQHYSGNTFNASLTISVPVLDQDELVDVVFDGLLAEFEIEQDVVRGFGLWGGVWGAGVGVEQLKGTSARELAEVWFDHDAGLVTDTLSSDQKPLIRGLMIVTRHPSGAESIHKEDVDVAELRQVS